LEFARVNREPFTYISPKEGGELPKCVGTSQGKLCCGLGKRTLAYYDPREEKWTEYPEFEGDEDEEEILAYYDMHKEKWTVYPEFEKDEDEKEILTYYDLHKEKWTEYPEFERDEDEKEILA